MRARRAAINLLAPGARCNASLRERPPRPGGFSEAVLSRHALSRRGAARSISALHSGGRCGQA